MQCDRRLSNTSTRGVGRTELWGGGSNQLQIAPSSYCESGRHEVHIPERLRTDRIAKRIYTKT